MMKIWIESSKFNSSQILADEEKLILMIFRFSQLEIRKICGQINKEHTQRETHKLVETLNIENHTITDPSITSIIT